METSSSHSVLSPLQLLFPLSFLSDVCFKVRHRSGCLFPAFLQASLLQSITFICHSGSDGLSTLPHMSRHILYLNSDAHPLNIPKSVSLLAHVFTFFYTSNAQTRRMDKSGCEGEKLHTQSNVLTSAPAFVPGLKQPLQFAGSVRRRALGTADCINYTCAAIDPLSNLADCLHPPHVKANCNC